MTSDEASTTAVATAEYCVLMSSYLKTTVEQLRATFESMVSQTVPPSQIVLVLDGPITAELERYVNELSASHPDLMELVWLPKNVGTGLAKAAGIPHCAYELIAHMDTDDFSLPQRCELQLAEFAADPELAALGGFIQEVYSDGHETAIRAVPQTTEQIRRYAARRNPMNHQSVMYRKSAVLAAGNYQHMVYFEDYWLFLRMLAAGQQLRNLNQVLVHAEADGVNERRGGLRYVRYTWRFMWEARKLGAMNWSQWLTNVVQRSLVAIVPRGLRAKFYSVALRKTA